MKTLEEFLEKINDDDLKLRLFKEDDAENLVSLANNKKIAVNLRDGFPHPYTINDAAKFIQMFMNQDPHTFLAIEYKGVHVGNIGITLGTDVHRKSAEIGYFVAEPYWNKGIATRAIKMMTRVAFEYFRMIRVYAGIYEYNKASMHVLEKCGYKNEGVNRKAVIKSGKVWDEVRYAIVKDQTSSTIEQ